MHTHATAAPGNAPGGHVLARRVLGAGDCRNAHVFLSPNWTVPQVPGGPARGARENGFELCGRTAVGRSRIDFVTYRFAAVKVRDVTHSHFCGSCRD